MLTNYMPILAILATNKKIKNSTPNWPATLSFPPENIFFAAPTIVLQYYVTLSKQTTCRERERRWEWKRKRNDSEFMCIIGISRGIISDWLAHCAPRTEALARNVPRYIDGLEKVGLVCGSVEQRNGSSENLTVCCASPLGSSIHTIPYSCPCPLTPTPHPPTHLLVKYVENQQMERATLGICRESI